MKLSVDAKKILDKLQSMELDSKKQEFCETSKPMGEVCNVDVLGMEVTGKDFVSFNSAEFTSFDKSHFERIADGQNRSRGSTERLRETVHGPKTLANRASNGENRRTLF